MVLSGEAELAAKDGYLYLLLEKSMRPKITGDIFLSVLDIQFKNRYNWLHYYGSYGFGHGDKSCIWPGARRIYVSEISPSWTLITVFKININQSILCFDILTVSV